MFYWTRTISPAPSQQQQETAAAAAAAAAAAEAGAAAAAAAATIFLEFKIYPKFTSFDEAIDMIHMNESGYIFSHISGLPQKFAADCPSAEPSSAP